MKQLFISHVKEDRAKAEALSSALEAEGYSTWYYERDSVAGQSYLAEMGRAVDESQAVVVLISPDSMTSHQVTSEIVRAHESRKPLFPVLIRVTHEAFQSKQPEWRTAMGSAVSVEWNDAEPATIFRRIAQGLRASGVHPASGSRVRRKLFQLGYVYGQYAITEQKLRPPLLAGIEEFWKGVAAKEPPEAVPLTLRSLPTPHIIGELASFLRSALSDTGVAESNAEICLLGYMLFCQPLTQGSEPTAELLVRYSQAAGISEEERRELRSDCVSPDLRTREGAMAFFNKWTSVIEDRL